MPQPLDYSPLDRAGAASIFFPRSDTRPAPAGATDLLIDVEPGVAVAARFYVHDPAAPTILYFHGNGEVAADHDDIAPLYHEIGLNLFVAEFRGYGQSGGQPSYASLIADAHPVVERFHSLLDADGFAPQRLVMGRSLGSGPALEVAANASDRFLGCIIESGAANIRRMLTRLGIAETLESVQLADQHEAKIRSIRLPTLILHGEHDELVPPAYAAELYDLLSDVDRDLIIIPGAGHNDILWRGMRQYFDAINAFTTNLVPDP
ncbi:MAG: alpha/beta hydrolase [Chloroflexi bacterium]|nr:alpha/beta hydrolase [Chloroflexota bacterium]